MATNVFVKCDRCNGKGLIKCFSHVQAGVCFRCRLGKEALSAPGDFFVDVAFDGKAVRVKNRVHVRMSDLTKLSRKALINAAAKEFAEMSEPGVHGFHLIQLAAIARVADPALRARITSAVMARGTSDERSEFRSLSTEFGFGESETSDAV